MSHLVDCLKERDSGDFLVQTPIEKLPTLAGLPAQSVDKDVGIDENEAVAG